MTTDATTDVTTNVTTKEQQFAYLQAMGIQTWQPRVAVAGAEQVAETQIVETQVVDVHVAELPANDAQNDASKATLNDVRDSVAQLEALQAGAPAVEIAPIGESVSEPPFMVGEEPPLPTDDYMPSLDMSEAIMSSAPAAPAVINVSTLGWPELQSAVSACVACDLHQSRTQTVFGVGSHTAEWMIIGEAPKVDEDQQGQPFVGDSGQLLDNMLRALGLKREQVFISNILKCRPEDDRAPSPEEVAQCEPYLQRQIELVAPKVILAMGAVAAHSLLKLKTPVTKLRGELHHYGETPLVVTYHPAYLLRKPSEKARSWADLKFAASVVLGEMKGEQP